MHVLLFIICMCDFFCFSTCFPVNANIFSVLRFNVKWWT